MLIKVKNGIATREPVPYFLLGLLPESLADLSWTDPALGVSDCAWWPEYDNSVTLGEWEEYGEEHLYPDHENKIVVVTRDIIPMPEARKEEVKKQKLADIDSQVQSKIRERYTQEDEWYFSRIGVGVALGVYQFQQGEQEALIAYGAYVESIRDWAREERAKVMAV